MRARKSILSWLTACLLLFAASPGLSKENLDAEDVLQALAPNVTEETRQEVRRIVRDYNQFEDNRAMALAYDASGQSAIGIGSATSEVAATSTALQYCENYKATNTSLSTPCEIVVANATIIPTTRQLKRDVAPEDPAFVWRVQGNTTVYLGGTIHAIKPTFYPLSSAFEDAFNASAQIAVEINPLLAADPARVQQIRDLVLRDSAAVKRSIPRDTLEKVQNFSRSQGFPADALMDVPPAMISTNIATMRFVGLGFLPNSGIDLHFARRATASSRPVLELETIESQLRLLADAPMDVQVDMLDNTLTELPNSDQLVLRLVKSWLRGDPDHLYGLMQAEYEGDQNLEAFGRQLLDVRNVKMTEKIRGFLTGNVPTFVLVGAGHFGGNQGILALLERSGHRPTQLARNGTDYAPRTQNVEAAR